MNYLVVDDEPAICEGTIRRLRKIIRPGDRILAAYSGEEALELLAVERIAVLITDIQMDALSGEHIRFNGLRILHHNDHYSLKTLPEPCKSARVCGMMVQQRDGSV